MRPHLSRQAQHKPAVGEKIAGMTIGDILGLVGDRPIDLLKLDVEGAELDLFSIESDRWLDRVNVIAVELHDRIRPGCAGALDAALASRSFVQEFVGENIFIKLTGADAAGATEIRA